MKTEAEANRAIEKYADTVRRICFVYLKNQADTEDIFQDVFLKYILNKKPFKSDAHEKAWLIRVTINACKDVLKSFFRKRVVSMDEFQNVFVDNPDYDNDLMDAVMNLETKYREVIYLYYYEGYSAVEISKLLGKKENTVYTWLSRSKAILREQLGGEYNG